MSEPIKVAWVGTAHIHTPGFVDLVTKRGVSSVGVWDHDAARAAKNAEKLSTKVATLDDLATADVDGYVVCSETNRHLELIEKLAKTGKPIFAEKPMGPDGATSAKILSLFQANGNVFHTGYFMRGVPAILTLKKKLEEGVFGQVTRVRGSNCHSGSLGGWFDTDWRWMADRSQAGVGAYGDLGTHALDILLWLFGEVEAVTGTLAMGTARYEGCDETGEAIILFKSGVIGTLAAAWDDVANPHFMQVSGTKAFATIGGDLQIAQDGQPLTKVDDLVPQVPSGFGAYLDYLEGKDVTLVKAEEAAERDKVMSAIYKAAETHTWVRP